MADLFDFQPRPQLFAVMGNPVNHSLSPQIHGMFADELGIKLDYRRIQVDVGGFRQAVDGFRASGGRGVNVTVPFKIEAFEMADHFTERANAARAANTLSFNDDLIHADNTDGEGMRRDITGNLGFAVAGTRVLVVGAGGAVRGVLGPLIDEAPAALMIVNRSVDKAQTLAEAFARPLPIETGGFDHLAGRSFDLVINGTSASLHGELPPLPAGLFKPGSLAYDMMYSRQGTPFLRWAADQGAGRCSDGLGMLVEQAAESFHVWHGQRPHTAPVIEKLRWSA